MQKGKRFALNYIWISLFAIGLGWYLSASPKYGDDYDFLIPMSDWIISQGTINLDDGVNLFKSGIPFAKLWECMERTMQYDNARLCNLASMPFLLLPKWLTGVAITLLWVWGALKSLSWIGISAKRSPLIPAAIFLWSFGIQWVFMSVVVFQFDYTLSVPIFVAYITYFFKQRNDIAYLIGLVLFSIAAGWWQEAFSVPMVAGLCALLIYPKHRNLKTICAILAMLAGIAMIFTLSPAHQGRYGSMLVIKYFDFVSWATKILPNSWAESAMLVVAVVAIIKRKSRALPSNPLMLMIFVAALASWGMYGYSQLMRVNTFGAFLSTIIILRSATIIWPKVKDAHTLISAVLSGIMLIAVYSMWLQIDLMMEPMRKEVNKFVETAYAGDENNPVAFVNMPQLDEQPWITGYTPSAHFLAETTICLYFHVDPTKFYIAPEELEYVTADSGTPIAPGVVREYKGKLFAPDNNCSYVAHRIYLDFGKGDRFVPCQVSPFTSKADGKKYIYIRPQTDWYVSHFKEIKRAQFPTDPGNTPLMGE